MGEFEEGSGLPTDVGETVAPPEPAVRYAFRGTDESGEPVVTATAGAVPAQAAPAPGQPAPAAGAQPPLTDKDNPNRFQYWQSQYDRLRQTVEPVMDFIPIARALAARPDLMASLQAGLMGQPTTPGQPMPEDAAPKVPEKPQRPPNYDVNAAYSDPESPSFKFREADEQYQQKLADYLVQRDQHREKAMQAVIDTMRQERAAQEQAMMLRQGAVMAGVPENEVDHFMEMFSNPDPAVMMRDLAQLYNMRRQQAGAGSDSPQLPSATLRAQELLRQRMEGRAPLPLPGAPGAGQPPVADPNKAFSTSLKEAIKRNNS